MLKIKFVDKEMSKKIQQIMEKGQIILDTQVLKDSNHYAPMDEGTLIGSGIRFTQPGTGKIIWETPYARRLYYNPQYNFSRDSNPNAQGLWFEAAKSRHLKDWQRIVQDNIRR